MGTVLVLLAEAHMASALFLAAPCIPTYFLLCRFVDGIPKHPQRGMHVGQRFCLDCLSEHMAQQHACQTAHHQLTQVLMRQQQCQLDRQA
jgi:hypothetical protein